MKVKVLIEDVSVKDIEAEMFSIGVQVKTIGDDGKEQNYCGTIDEDGNNLELSLINVDLFFNNLELSSKTCENIKKQIENELKEAINWTKDYIGTRLYIIHKLGEVEEIWLKKKFCEKEIEIDPEYT